MVSADCWLPRRRVGGTKEIRDTSEHVTAHFVSVLHAVLGENHVKTMFVVTKLLMITFSRFNNATFLHRGVVEGCKYFVSSGNALDCKGCLIAANYPSRNNDKKR